MSEDVVIAEPKKTRFGSRILTFVLVAALASSAINWNSHKSVLTDLAQSIIDDNVSNNALSVDHLSMPAYLAIPFIELALPEFSGYFSIAGNGGRQLSSQCDAQTINYTVRAIGNGKISMQIDGVGLLTLEACQPHP